MLKQFIDTVLVFTAFGGLSLATRQAAAESFASAGAPVTTTEQNERFYVVLLAHQSADNQIRLSHTFAAFFRTTGTASRQRIVETSTISWFPVSEIVSPARPAEPGVNKSLAASLAWAKNRGLQVTVHGPFEIRPELFQRAVRQATRLDRGELKYKAFDRYGRETAKNCIHALADIVEDRGRLNSGAKRGDEATLLVVRHFEPFFVSGQVAAESKPLLQSLRLQQYAAAEASLVAAGGLGR